MSADPNAEILRALDRLGEKIDGVEKRLGERIEGVEARITSEAASIRTEVSTLRGDVAGLAREIIDAADRSVRDAEVRLRSDADRRHDEISGQMGEAWRETAAHVDATAKELGDRIAALEARERPS